VKLSLDPYMFRQVPLLELPGLVADLGYQWLELSPRDDFLPFFNHPRVDDARVAAFKAELEATGVGVSSVLPLYITAELGVDVMNSEFNGRPEQAARSESQFWRSMEELLPVFEAEGVRLVLEPHPDDFEEGGRAAIDLIRGINSPLVSFLYCAPHTFHMGNDAPGIIGYAGDLLTNVHVADSFDHTGSSGLRYIVNPPGSTVRVHQHLDIGQGEVDFDELFASLASVGFDGTVTACVFAWEDRARDSSRFMREKITDLLMKQGMQL
jgi:myo-inositol catabolism protein IolH